MQPEDASGGLSIQAAKTASIQAVLPTQWDDGSATPPPGSLGLLKVQALMRWPNLGPVRPALRRGPPKQIRANAHTIQNASDDNRAWQGIICPDTTKHPNYF